MRIRRVLAVLIVVAAAAAFAVDRAADSIARDRLLRALRASFTTEVTVGDVTVDVLSLAVEVKDLRIADAPGFGAEPLLEIPTAHGSLVSIAGMTDLPQVSALIAPGAIVRLAFAPDGRLNLDEARVHAPATGKPARVALRSIELRGARVTLTDRSTDGSALAFSLDDLDATLADLVLGAPADRDADLRVRATLRAGDGEAAPLVLAAAIATPPDAPASVRARFEVVGLDLGPLGSRGTEVRTLIGGRFVDVAADLSLADRRITTGINTLSSGGERMHVAVNGPIDSPQVEDPRGLLARVPAEKARRLGHAAIGVAGAVVEGGERAIDSLGRAGVAAVDATTNAVESVVDGARDTATGVGNLAKNPDEIPGAVVDTAKSIGTGAFDLLKGTVEKGTELVTGTAKTAQSTVTDTVKDVFLETPEEAAKRHAAQVERFHHAVRTALEFRAALAKEQNDAATTERVARELAALDAP